MEESFKQPQHCPSDGCGVGRPSLLRALPARGTWDTLLLPSLPQHPAHEAEELGSELQAGTCSCSLTPQKSPQQVNATMG